jgi:hypothetical protein
MASSALSPLKPTGTASPVFVDDSGRRHLRVRWVTRALVALLVGYVALTAAGLMGSVSLPIVHVGEVGVLPAQRRHGHLGAGSRASALPSAIAAGSAIAGLGVPTATTGAAQSTASASPAAPSLNDRVGRSAVSPGGPTTVQLPVTVSPSTGRSATTVPGTTVATTPRQSTSTTSRPHGPSSTPSTSHVPSSTPTTSHGPPSTTPGKGSRP